jgi:hypothetical protein
MTQDDCRHESASHAEIQQKIDQYGCFITIVPPDGHLPGFAYTTGLYQQFRHPEIICYGFSPGTAGTVLNDACGLIKNGQVLAPGRHYDEFLENYPVQFIPVEHVFYRDHFGVTMDFYSNDAFPVLQLVWPDKQSFFPWDAEFDASLKFAQPLLDRNTDFRFFEERNVAVFTTSEVLEGAPILHVYHDEDGDWQFHSEAEPNMDHAKVVSLDSMVKKDPTINALYDLTYGQSAWRATPDSPWERD